MATCKKDTILWFSIGQADRRTKSNPVRNKCKHDESLETNLNLLMISSGMMQLRDGTKTSDTLHSEITGPTVFTVYFVENAFDKSL